MRSTDDIATKHDRNLEPDIVTKYMIQISHRHFQAVIYGAGSCVARTNF